MVQIDNVKMWESLIRNYKNGQLMFDRCIELALNDQGLKVAEDGEIISIMPQNEDFKFEKGKYYVYIGENCKYFTNKKSYQVIMDSYEDDYNICFIDNVGDRHPWSLKAAFMSFRPATEEEIKGAEPKQENFQDFKELERNGKNDELTEFEKEVAHVLVYQCHEGSLETEEEIEKAYKQYYKQAKFYAPMLLEKARKQIASEINTEEMSNTYFDFYKELNCSRDTLLKVCQGYRQGIEDVLKKIKGE